LDTLIHTKIGDKKVTITFEYKSLADGVYDSKKIPEGFEHNIIATGLGDDGKKYTCNLVSSDQGWISVISIEEVK